MTAGVGVVGSAGRVGIISLSRGVEGTVTDGEGASEVSGANVNDADMIDDVAVWPPRLGMRGRFRLLNACETNETGERNH